MDGIRFPSKKQAARYSELKLLERAGAIRNLELEVPFKIIVNGVVVGAYRADFVYFEGESYVIEDSKGVQTPLFKFKRKCVEAQYRVKIRLT